MRDLTEYGLNKDYDFREIHISTTSDISEVHEKILKNISPAIIDLEKAGLINGYHFILHAQIDMRLSSDSWDKKEIKIKEILRKHGLSDDLTPWGPMSPDRYGGETGVLLCYNNLEMNSRLISALVELRDKTGDDNAKALQERLICNQWSHYLYIQYGITNDKQIGVEFNNALGWLETIVVKNQGDPAAKEFAERVLTHMEGTINKLKQQWLS